MGLRAYNDLDRSKVKGQGQGQGQGQRSRSSNTFASRSMTHIRPKCPTIVHY